MLDYRCRQLHPKFPPRECGKLLFLSAGFEGNVELLCSRCGKWTKVTPDMGKTASRAMPVALTRA